MSHFKEQQKRLIEQNSKERKEAEEQRIKQNEREYWADMKDQSDEDNDWDREPNLKEEEL